MNLENNRLIAEDKWAARARRFADEARKNVCCTNDRICSIRDCAIYLRENEVPKEVFVMFFTIYHGRSRLIACLCAFFCYHFRVFGTSVIAKMRCVVFECYREANNATLDREFIGIAQEEFGKGVSWLLSWPLYNIADRCTRLGFDRLGLGYDEETLSMNRWRTYRELLDVFELLFGNNGRSFVRIDDGTNYYLWTPATRAATETSAAIEYVSASLLSLARRTDGVEIDASFLLFQSVELSDCAMAACIAFLQFVPGICIDFNRIGENKYRILIAQQTRKDGKVSQERNDRTSFVVDTRYGQRRCDGLLCPKFGSIEIESRFDGVVTLTDFLTAQC